MKEIKLSKRGKNKNLWLVALVDDEDFEYLNQWNWCVTFAKHTAYAQRGDYSNGKKKTILMHRLILGLTDPKIDGDHKDHNGLNNQRSNLRIATRSQNICNTILKKQFSSKYKGVFFYKRSGLWRVQIRVNHKVTYLGSYATEEQAAIVYNEAALKQYGEFANLNTLLTNQLKQKL